MSAPGTNDGPADHEYSDAAAPRAAGIVAEGLSVSGPDGVAFGPVDLRFREGGLHVIQGPSGSGRTSLLLSLAGRFSISSGSIDVHGRRKARAIREICAIAGFEDIDEIDDAVRVRDVIREQLAWNTSWWRRSPRFDDDRYTDLCAPAFGPRTPPEPAAYIQDLGELDLMLLRITLAIMARPLVLVVDDIEQVRSIPEQIELAHRLADIGRHSTVIAAAINPLPDPAPPHTLHTLLIDDGTGGGAAVGSHAADSNDADTAVSPTEEG